MWAAFADMHPIVSVPLAGRHVLVSTYGLFVALGICIGLALATWRSRRPDVMLIAGVSAVLIGGVASQAWHEQLHGARGFSSMGGILAGLVVVVGVARAQGVIVRDTLDVIVPAGLVGLAVGRVGCLLGGCCFGVTTDGWWGVTLPEVDALARHPVQLYEALLLGVVAVIALRRRRRGGDAAWIGLIGYGLVRAATDCLRDPAGSDLLPGWTAPTVAQLCALAFVSIGLIVRRQGRGAGDDFAVPAR